uniref:SOWAHA-C winged helix-turn-helix domain-containing protein n=1 Tax=Denticeps clupeoides TaxID=299321 RepID=A0AAY4EQ45_9TELE
MAAGFSQDSVLGFLLRSGGAVRNSELLAHFRPYLREHENREHNRELFKKFVNAVAVVKHQEGTPYILLKKRYSADAGRPPVRHEEGHKPREAPNPDPKASSHATDRTDRNGGTCVARQPAVDSTETKRQSFEEAGNKRPGLPSDLEHNGVEAGRTGAARRPDHAAREVRSSEAAAAPPQAGPRCRGSGEGRISSSLSATYRVSTPPRLHGSRDGVSLSEASSTQSLSEQRSPAVPLPPREHEWLVKAASADWPDVYSLFREDNSLLNKKDFISGYTIVHWIAKHGDHRVLNTLSYGVAKAGMKLDVDARSVGGYTPLHLAAIHGHKKVISLLVHKFQADVALRDASGRKAWQYLSKDASGDVVQLLRAPQSKAAAAGPVPPSYDVTLLVPRPATGPAAVKRHSSLAALFKHKSLARVTAHSEFAV